MSNHYIFIFYVRSHKSHPSTLCVRCRWSHILCSSVPPLEPSCTRSAERFLSLNIREPEAASPHQHWTLGGRSENQNQKNNRGRHNKYTRAISRLQLFFFFLSKKPINMLDYSEASTSFSVPHKAGAQDVLVIGITLWHLQLFHLFLEFF